MQEQIYLFASSKHPDAISVKSLEVSFLKPSIDFSSYDYLIITSKQTVKALEQYTKKDFIDIPALCVSEKTATAYEKFGGKILDVGDGYGDNLVKNIKNKPKEKKWLYLRAELIASDFVYRCKSDGFDIEEKVLYKSECSRELLDIEVCEKSTLIFTSPSAISCFLKTHTIKNNTNIVVIGKTTAASLPKNIKYKISKITSIQSCIELALSF
ncbi:MAG: uroporphyrinogen-III synthase [Sulfurimonas sp.]|nr:uroporphyrinogen-III synthase [Sulfurimonas sp.]